MTNYGGLSPEYSDYNHSEIVIIPVPYDGTSTWGKGADRGPEAILEASANMELYDIDTDSEVYLRGIHTSAPVEEMSSPEKMVEQVYGISRKHLENGKFLVTLGSRLTVSIHKSRPVS